MGLRQPRRRRHVVDAERLDDILAAIEAIRSHLGRGDLSDGLVYDAVRVRLIEIGKAAKSIPAEVVSTEPGTPWRDIAAMRDRLAHRYFDTQHSIVQSTVDNDLPALESAVCCLRVAAGVDDGAS
jgi:uncharacterized protein with HEPN domain